MRPNAWEKAQSIDCDPGGQRTQGEHKRGHLLGPEVTKELLASIPPQSRGFCANHGLGQHHEGPRIPPPSGGRWGDGTNAQFLESSTGTSRSQLPLPRQPRLQLTCKASAVSLCLPSDAQERPQAGKEAASRQRHVVPRALPPAGGDPEPWSLPAVSCTVVPASHSDARSPATLPRGSPGSGAGPPPSFWSPELPEMAPPWAAAALPCSRAASAPEAG